MSTAPLFGFNIHDRVYEPKTLATGTVIALCSGIQEDRLQLPPEGTPLVQPDPVKDITAPAIYWPTAAPLVWLQTYTGLQMLLPSFTGPFGASVISLKETAATLSRICRFGARTHPVSSLYTVAEHSVRVADCVKALGGTALEQFQAINHEGDEALLGFDPPGPALKLLPDLRALKHCAHVAYHKHYGLPVELPAIVKHADLVLLATEKRDLMLAVPTEWVKLPAPLEGKIVAWPNPHARFTKRWRELAKLAGFEGAT